MYAMNALDEGNAHNATNAVDTSENGVYSYSGIDWLMGNSKPGPATTR